MGTSERKDEKIKQVIQLMDMILEDVAMPKNIRTAMEAARTKLKEPGGDADVRAGGAIYCLGEVSEDINLSAHARIQIWNVLSALETVKEIK